MGLLTTAMKTVKKTYIFLLIFGLFILVSFLYAGYLGNKKLSQEKETNLITLMQQVIDLNEKKEHKKAIDLIISAIEKQKEGSMLRLVLARTFDLFLQEDLGMQQEKINENPHSTESYVRASSILELMDNNDNALEMLVNGIAKNPHSVDIWMNIARLELKKSRNKDALDIFKEVIRLDPKNSDAYNNAAFLIATSNNTAKDDLKKAYKYIQKAILLKPKNTEYLDTLTQVEKKLQKKPIIINKQAEGLPIKNIIFE